MRSMETGFFSVDKAYRPEQNGSITDVLEDQRAIIRALGDVYYSVLLVDYKNDRVTIYRHEEEDGREIADYFAAHDFCWSDGISMYCRELVSEESRDVLLRALSLENLSNSQEDFSINYQKTTKEGKRYYEGRVTFVEKNAGGRVAVVGTRSIDDAVSQEKELRTRLQMIAAAVGRVYPMVAEVNLTKNRYRMAAYDEFVNKTAAMEGTLDDFIQVGITTLPDKDEAAEFERLFNRQAQIDAFKRGEEELMLRHRQWGDDGQIHWMETRVIFVAGEDGDMHEISLSRPIDEEIQINDKLAKARDAAEAANRAKSTFLFNMSHDIRTPMNAIMGFADLASRYKNDPEKLDDYLKKIRTSSDYMLKLLNGVLEMARIERGKIKLDLEPAELGQICRNALSLFAEDAKKKNLRYDYDIGFDKVMVNIDPARVEEIFANIVSNAVKYTGDGGSVNITVELEEHGLDGAVMKAVVKDTGIGMSEEFLPNIFDSFERERNNATAEIQGTGLGMGITKKLIEIMGGNIDIKSELGAGTEVTVVIPVERIESPVIYKENIRAEDYAQILSGKRVLLAEDNDLNAEIAMELLCRVGLSADRAEDGVQCVSMLYKAEPYYYDAILMDIQMPNLDGYMAAVKIRKLNDPVKSGIPIIAMTANAFEEDREKAMSMGMDGFVSKPIEAGKLFETLAHILK